MSLRVRGAIQTCDPTFPLSEHSAFGAIMALTVHDRKSRRSAGASVGTEAE